MKNTFEKTVRSLLLASLLSVMGQVAGAQETPGATAKMPTALPVTATAASVAVNHVLKATYINSVRPTSLSVLPSGLVAIDPTTTITCPGTTGTCTIEFEQNIQVIGQTDNNDFNFCVSQDGSIVPPGCPSSGEIPNGHGSANAFVFSFTQKRSGVSVGTQTVQTLIDSVSGGQIGFYTMIYRVYKP